MSESSQPPGSNMAAHEDKPPNPEAQKLEFYRGALSAAHELLAACGWFPFGHHAECSPVPDLEFWGQDDSGLPVFERQSEPAAAQQRDRMNNDGPMTLVKAIDVIARHCVAASNRGVDWEDYPELGEHDLMRVSERVDALLSVYPSEGEYNAAIEFFAVRAMVEQ